MKKLTALLVVSLLCLAAVPTNAEAGILSKPMSQLLGRISPTPTPAPSAVPSDRPTIQPAPCGTSGVSQCPPPPPNPIPPPRCIWAGRFCYMPPS